MRALPDMRKPTAATVGFLNNGASSLATLDAPDISESLAERQAFRIRQRFGLSGALARAVAELAYNAGGAA